MASRYTDTLLWDEDWFCDLSGEYQLLFKYIMDKCDNAGVWKPNKIDFEIKTKFKVNLDSFLSAVNADRGDGDERIMKLKSGRWFITGFMLFQWFNKHKTFDLVLTNKLHQSLYESLLDNGVILTKVRGLKEVLKGSMVMVMGSSSLEEMPIQDRSTWLDFLKKDNTLNEQFHRYGYKFEDYPDACVEFHAINCNGTYQDYHAYRKHFGYWMPNYHKSLDNKSKVKNSNQGGKKMVQ